MMQLVQSYHSPDLRAAIRISALGKMVILIFHIFDARLVPLVIGDE